MLPTQTASYENTWLRHIIEGTDMRKVISMKCGTKCFVVEAEINEKMQTIPVTARTATHARKVVRLEYGDQLKIISVRSS